MKLNSGLPSAKITFRLKSVLTGILTSFSIIALYLFYLQIYLTTFFFTKSQRNFLRIEKILSPRGNILDNKGNLLATNRPVISIYWQGTGNRHLTPSQLTTLSHIQEIINKNSDLEQLTIAERQAKKFLIAADITLEQLSRVIEQLPHDKNIRIISHFKRYYPHKTLASHIVGYLGYINFEQTGKMGLEQLLEDDLKGKPGELLKTINSLGKHLEERELKAALAGAEIVTTIDLDLQRIAEESFLPDQVGALILMESQTGALRAIVSRPSFDPNIFLSPLSPATWQSLQQAKHPFINRAFSAAYPPASIFKLVTLAAALEQNIITPDKQWYCSGYVLFAGRPYHCDRRQGHGLLNTHQALAHSCNIPFFEIGKKIKIDTLAEYARRFGLGSKTNTLFPEKSGLIPTSHWKRERFHEPWWPGDTESAVIGQSYLLVTPIQVARMIAALGEGYLVTPRILESEPIRQQPLQISTETRQFLKSCMRAAVNIGSAQQLKRMDDLELYVKTGTAQTCSLDKRDFKTKSLDHHGWLVAYFKYKNEPPFTLVVLIENIGSSRVATALTKRFLLAYKQLVTTGHSISSLELLKSIKK